MNTLIIVANPKEKSFSAAIADKYKELAVAKGNSVNIVDLYKTEHKQSFYDVTDPYSTPNTPEMDYFQAEITKADELLFVFPYWWGGMPAILKNFIDWNFSSGFAFKYEDGKTVGMLKGKVMKIYTTTGAPLDVYEKIGAYDRLKDSFDQQMIQFCGMTLGSCNMFGSIGSRNTDHAKVLNQIEL